MRKSLAVVCTTGALLFGGAGVANAAVDGVSLPASTHTVLAQNDNTTNGNNNDKTGLWGLAGLLGLLGLAGLVRRNPAHPAAGTAAGGLGTGGLGTGGLGTGTGPGTQPRA